MVENINLRLEELFKKWEEESEAHNEARENYGDHEVIFTRDGLLLKHTPEGTVEAAMKAVEEAWWKAPKRIAVLLKDQPASFRDDLRYWFFDCPDDNEGSKKRKENNRQLKVNFLHRLVSLVWGFSHITASNYGSLGEASHEDLVETFNSTPLALVECKKQGGGTSISNKVLKEYLDRYGHLLREELEILQPNVIVCTSGVIYNYVLTHHFAGKELMTFGEGHNSVRYCPETKTLIFCSYHPSARISGETFYEGVMDHYRAFLREQA